MIKTIKIMNYQNKKVNVKIKDFENVVRLRIEVVSGDEILHVLYKDYSVQKYDSAYLLDIGRIMDYHDDLYIIYDITKNIDFIKSWNKRTNSYDYELK